MQTGSDLELAHLGKAGRDRSHGLQEGLRDEDAMFRPGLARSVVEGSLRRGRRVGRVQEAFRLGLPKGGT